MEVDLRFGEEVRTLRLDDENLLGMLKLGPSWTIPDVEGAVREALRNPIGSPRLSEIARRRKAGDALVIVDDITRPRPSYHGMLVPLIEELLAGGVEKSRIRFLIAVGTHRPHKPEENDRIFGRDLTSAFRFACHDCDSPDLVSLGNLSTGSELRVNRLLSETSLLVVTGGIEPHYFAGYTGGRKSILPGVSGRDTITRNHAKIVRRKSALGVLKCNPVHEEMEEAARRAGVAFILNVIQNDRKQLVNVVCGDLVKAFLKGVESANRVFKVAIEEKADVVIASGGGYPKDLNLYQSQKIVNNAFEITREGGTIVVLAECRDGVGQPVFERWMKRHGDIDEIAGKKESEIEVEGHRAYDTARMMQSVEVVMITRMRREEVESLHFTYKESLDEAIAHVIRKHGPGFKAYVIPQGGAIFPVVQPAKPAVPRGLGSGVYEYSY